MPLTLVRSDSNARLWSACTSRFLDELDGCTGPGSYPSHLWIAHRAQRDLLLDAVEERGGAGWLSPPFSFLSQLPTLFEIIGKPIGLLTGRLLVSRLAGAAAERHGFAGAPGADTPGRGHMVDRVLSELLPEGVTPEGLGEAVAALGGDDFARRRNAWLLDTHRDYVARLDAAGMFDPRAIHSLVADRIDGGALRSALRGATRLHVFGPTSLRGRHRLFAALARQKECEVVVYLPLDMDDDQPDEWTTLAASTEVLRRGGGGGPRGSVTVQPVPDAVREADWVSTNIKRMLRESDVEPHQIAVIARSGREDTRRVHDALRRAGVPSTARLRSRLHEVPALRALLQLFLAAAEDFAWTPFAAVLRSPYVGHAMDIRAIDVLASRARPRGLGEWLEGIASLAEEAVSNRGWVLRRAGVSLEMIERCASGLEVFSATVAGLFDPRTELEWIEATREVLRDDSFGLKQAVNRVIGDRWDIVRLDQRAVLALDGLLEEWGRLGTASGQPLDVAEWHTRLRRLLESNEIAISTPAQLGVQVLEAHEAGLTPFRHAFVVHANEGAFPPRAAGGLFTEFERERLAETGLRLATRDLTFERERTLWMAVTGSRSVTITYRTADANGVPRLASLFVPAHDRSEELARTRRELPDDRSGDEPVTRQRLLEAEALRFVRLRRGGKASTFSTPDPEAIRAATLRAFAEECRTGGLDETALRQASAALTDAAVGFDGTAGSLDAVAVFGNQRPLSQRPTPWNGAIRDPVILAWLAERYSARHEWSASQLERYATRPFDFLLERVLGLGETEAVEDEASRLTIGGLVHSILEDFYERRIGRPSDQFDEAARQELAAAFDEQCDAFEASERQWVGLPHVWSATREELRDRLFKFVEWEFSRPKAGTPMAVEFAFGRGSDTAAIDLGGPGRTEPHLPLLVGGRIDRVDRLGANSSALQVIDYKSGAGAPSPRAFTDGAAVQAALYMAAIDAAGLGSVSTGTYRTVRAPADRAKRSAADIDHTVVIAREIARRVRAGLFEAVQACSTELKDWQPGRDIARSCARIESGTRFDDVAPMPLPGSEAGGS